MEVQWVQLQALSLVSAVGVSLKDVEISNGVGEVAGGHGGGGAPVSAAALHPVPTEHRLPLVVTLLRLLHPLHVVMLLALHSLAAHPVEQP